MAQTIFGTETPDNLNNFDGDSYSLGTQFEPLVDGQATHGEWYFAVTPQETPVEIGIFRDSDQVLLGSATFPGSLGPGRHQVEFDPPIALVAAGQYRVVVWTVGRYVSTPGYFVSDKTSGDLYCPVTAGKFKVSPGLEFPDQQFGQANYWPDFVFVPDGDDPAEGSADAGLALTLAGAGARDSDGTAALGLGLAPAATGARMSKGAAAAGLGLAVAAAGARPAGGSAAAGLNLVTSASGLRSSRGTSALQVNFSVSATGSNGQSGRPVTPWPGEVVPVSSYPWTPRPVRSFQEVDQP